MGGVYVSGVCFTGHRSIKEPLSNLYRRLDRAIEKAVTDYKAMDFYVGGAVGFDMIAALRVLRLKKKYGSVHLHLVLPCPIPEMVIKWSDEDKAVFDDILNRADSITVISDRYYDGCMKDRNQRLVDLADTLCICYWNENDNRSGTGQTVRMAERKGIKICNLYKTPTIYK
ncbi:Protein of unknown function [Ruminococcaceae bacterium FB2012]|nr:Protein of unknown function [Ruminococcaceae bacterium FB2012]